MSPRDWENSYVSPPHWDLGRPSRRSAPSPSRARSGAGYWTSAAAPVSMCSCARPHRAIPAPRRPPAGCAGQQPGDGGPRRLARGDITTAFANGWRVDSIEPTTLDSPTDPDGIRAWLVTLTKEDSTC
jgi:hypothetical protein